MKIEKEHTIKGRIKIILIIMVATLFSNTYAVLDTFDLSLRHIFQLSSANQGDNTGTVGGNPRGNTGGYSDETIFWADISSLDGATINSASFQCYVTGVNVGGTAYLYDLGQKGTYSSTAVYDTYGTSSNWSGSKGSADFTSTGWKTINTTSLQNLVQSWVDGTTNKGLVLAGDFGYYANVSYIQSSARLIIDYTTVNRHKADNAIALNIGSSWKEGIIPVATDTVIWDNIVSGANTVSMGADVSWAGIRIDNPGGLVTINDNIITLGGGGIDMSSTTQDMIINSTISLSSNQYWTINAGKTLTIGGAITSAYTILKMGNGNLKLISNNSSFTGTTSLNGGALIVGDGGTNGIISGNILNNSTVIFDRSDDFAFPGNMSGTGSVLKNGVGTLTLKGNNGYSGTTTIAEGAIKIQFVNALGSDLTGTTVLDGAALIVENGVYCSENITINGSGISNTGALKSISIGAYLDGDISLESPSYIGVYTDTLIINGNINGVREDALTKVGDGVLRITNTNNIMGNTIISEGEIHMNGTAYNSAFTVYPSTVLSGTGAIDSLYVSSGGIVEPGDGDASDFLIEEGAVFNNSSILNFELGIISDTIKVGGDLTLDGIVNIDSINGFVVGTYTIMTYAGTLTDNKLSIGSTPNATYGYWIETGGGQVNLVVSNTAPIVVTIDADGGADYDNFDSLMQDISDKVINPDTVKFVGTNRDSFTYTISMDSVSLSDIYFKSEVTNPDSFPVIFYSPFQEILFLRGTSVHWDGVVFTGDKLFDYNSIPGGINHTFDNCVFRDFSSNRVISGFLDNTASLSFTNCLFEGNATTGGVIYGYMDDAGTSSITITNCTFDNNDFGIVSGYAANWSNFKIKNCIFTNTPAFSDDSLRAQTTYSHTDEIIAAYGIGCVSDSNPEYVENSRSVPSHWQLQNSSSAINIGSATNAPLTDIEGRKYDSLPAAGCWAGRGNIKPVASDNTITINEDGSHIFSAGDFNFSDSDIGDSFVKLQITQPSSIGELSLDNVEVTIDQEILVVDIPKLQFIPVPDSNGLNYDNFKFKVSDGTDYSDSAYTIVIDVAAVNDTPIVISPIPDIINDKDIKDSSIADLNNVFMDIENGNSLTFNAISLDSNVVTASIDSSDSVLSLTFVGNISDSTSVIVTAIDNGGLSISDTFSVIVVGQNTVPTVISPIEDLVVEEDIPDTVVADLNEVFLDAEDGSDLTFTTMSLDTNLVQAIVNNIDSTLILSLVANQSGVTKIVVTATDQQEASVSDTFSIVVTAVNDAPKAVNPMLDITVDEDAADTIVANLANVFLDAEDGLDLDFNIYSLDQSLVKGVINSDSTLTLTFMENANGTAKVIASATDNDNTIGYDTILVTVNSVNDAPILHSITPWVMEESAPTTITMAQVYATDVDGDELSMIIDSGAYYNVDSLTITPVYGFTGILTVGIRVTDNIDTSNLMNVEVEVKYTGENRPPVLTDAEIPPIEKNGSLRVTLDMLDAFDPDNDSLTILIWEDENFEVRGTRIIPNKGFTGHLNVSLQVTDGIIISREITVTVSVFEKVIDFFKGQVTNSDTYEASIGPNPIPPEGRTVIFKSSLEGSDRLEITIFDELANVIHRCEVIGFHNRFNYTWHIDENRMYRGRTYVVFMVYYKDGVPIRKDKRFIGVSQ